MKFTSLLPHYSRLKTTSPVWRLLCADNAPLILAFIKSTFEQEREIEIELAISYLDKHLLKSKDLTLLSSDVDARTYINSWCKSGWLRETNGSLSKRDAADIALRLCEELSVRKSTTTASRLKLVQEAIDEFLIDSSTDREERLRILEKKKLVIEEKIAALKLGKDKALKLKQEKERIKDIYQLASSLFWDFRKFEDEIRTLDKDLRVQLIQELSTKGQIMLRLFQKEDYLAQTDFGQAFQAFYEMLASKTTLIDMSSKLEVLTSLRAAKYLEKPELKTLRGLIGQLSRESQRILNVRRQTQERLRHFIDNGALKENLFLQKIISQAEKSLIQLIKDGVDPKTPVNISLPTGDLEAFSLDKMRLKPPSQKIELGENLVQKRRHGVDEKILKYVDLVSIKDVFKKMLKTLSIASCKMSLGEIIEKNPVKYGLEELVCYFRIAKAAQIGNQEQQECLYIEEKSGQKLEVTMPLLLIGLDDLKKAQAAINVKL